MKNNFEEALAFTLKEEGGWTNDSRDPGGATNWGITIADARKFWKANATPADVKAMPKSVAINIYKSKYWKTPYYDCDKLVSGLDLSVFDFGVNSGPSRAKRYLDQAVGGTDEQTIMNLNNNRLLFLQGLSTWPTFGRGWGARVKRCKALALEMNKRKPTIQPKHGVFAMIASTFAASVTYFEAHRTAILLAGLAALAFGFVVYLIRKHNVKNP